MHVQLCSSLIYLVPHKNRVGIEKFQVSTKNAILSLRVIKWIFVSYAKKISTWILAIGLGIIAAFAAAFLLDLFIGKLFNGYFTESWSDIASIILGAFLTVLVLVPSVAIGTSIAAWVSLTENVKAAKSIGVALRAIFITLTIIIALKYLVDAGDLEGETAAMNKVVFRYALINDVVFFLSIPLGGYVGLVFTRKRAEHNALNSNGPDVLDSEMN